MGARVDEHSLQLKAPLQVDRQGQPWGVGRGPCPRPGPVRSTLRSLLTLVRVGNHQGPALARLQLFHLPQMGTLGSVSAPPCGTLIVSELILIEFTFEPDPDVMLAIGTSIGQGGPHRITREGLVK